MNDKNQKAKAKKQSQAKNVLEALADIGSQTGNTITNEAKQINEEFLRQILGQQRLQEKRSGQLEKGSSVKMTDVLSGKAEREKELQEQLFFEKRLINEERESTSKKMQELRLRLQALMTEANKLVASTSTLTEEVKVAVMQNPVNASEYQVSFFESIIQMMISFRKKIDTAVDWMQGSSKRAEKKNYWSQYKKKGASFLLSPDHYSQRSAG